MPSDSPDRMRAAAELAQGWLIVRDPAQAVPLLDAVRSAILDKKNPVRSLHPIKPFVEIVRSYLEACQQLPIEDGLARIEQCLKGLPTLPNTTTTAKLYSRMHLAVVEQLVQTLTSEGFSQGAESRKWMDDDEFLTRRRIHIDTREALAGQRLTGNRVFLVPLSECEPDLLRRLTPFVVGHRVHEAGDVSLELLSLPAGAGWLVESRGWRKVLAETSRERIPLSASNSARKSNVPRVLHPLRARAKRSDSLDEFWLWDAGLAELAEWGRRPDAISP